MSPRSKRILTSALLGALTLTTTGCYREVVSAKGIGSDQHYPQRVQSKESPIDNALDPILDPLLGTDPQEGNN